MNVVVVGFVGVRLHDFLGGVGPSNLEYDMVMQIQKHMHLASLLGQPVFSHLTLAGSHAVSFSRFPPGVYKYVPRNGIE